LIDTQFANEGFPTNYRENICLIAEQETDHIQTISNVILANGATPITGCNYTFPYTNVTSFVELANQITTVGIGAFIGGAEHLTDNAVVSETAASILSVEGRHSAFLRGGLGASPFSSSFDTGLSPTWAYNLAQQYVVGCPLNQTLGLPILPRLNVTSIPPLNISAPSVVNNTLIIPSKPALYLNNTVHRVPVRQSAPVRAGPPYLNMTVIPTEVPIGSPALMLPLTPPTILHFTWDARRVNTSVLTPLYIALVNQNSTMPVFTQLENVSRILGAGVMTLPPIGLAGAVFAALTKSSNLTFAQLSSYGTLAGPVEILLS
jgi:hypothetical protein